MLKITVGWLVGVFFRCFLELHKSLTVGWLVFFSDVSLNYTSHSPTRYVSSLSDNQQLS